MKLAHLAGLVLAATTTWSGAALALGPAGGGYDGYMAAGARGGIVDVDHLGMTFTVGGFMDFGVADQVTILAGLDYWRDSDEDGGVTVTVRDLTLSGFGRYVLPTRGRSLAPYFGAGLALHMLEAEVKVGNGVTGGSADDSESELGLDLGGGVMFNIQATSYWLAELRYRSCDDDIDVDHIAITVGLAQHI
jgi:hypothetical protein